MVEVRGEGVREEGTSFVAVCRTTHFQCISDDIMLPVFT